MNSENIFLDPAIKDWVLLPIMLVMFLVGALRDKVTLLFTTSKKPDLLQIRENNALQRSHILRANANFIPFTSFANRRKHFTEAFSMGKYLKNPELAKENAQPPNPLTDPAGMEALMEGTKKNMASIIPQTLIMGWINFFFSGFIVVKLPFPLTVRFKSMLQRGIDTTAMDVAWVSSLSWYFLNLFGLRGIFTLVLGEGTAADGMKDMENFSPQAAMGQSPDAHKQFLSEKEFLMLHAHKWERENAVSNYISQNSF